MQHLFEAVAWLAACALYFAFSAAQGAAMRRLRTGGSMAAAAAASAIYLPSTVLILGFEGWPLAMRVLPLTVGLFVLALSIWQPADVPRWWQRSTAFRYLASTMAVSALAQIGLAWASASVAAAVVAAAAALASWASLRASPRVPVRPG